MFDDDFRAWLACIAVMAIIPGIFFAVARYDESKLLSPVSCSTSSPFDK